MSDKKKIELEYSVNSSVGILYKCFSTASGLEGWFADTVNLKGKNFIFSWDGSEEVAELVSKKDGEYVKFRWEEAESDEEYFEFRIKVDPLTADVAIIITDFVYEDEEEEARLLWDSQVNDLMHNIGS